MFYETTGFEITDSLESNGLVIKEELTRLPPKKFILWPEKFLYNHGWNVFGLYAFGKKLEENGSL